MNYGHSEQGKTQICHLFNFNHSECSGEVSADETVIIVTKIEYKEDMFCFTHRPYFPVEYANDDDTIDEATREEICSAYDSDSLISTQERCVPFWGA